MRGTLVSVCMIGSAILASGPVARLLSAYLF